MTNLARHLAPKGPRLFRKMDAWTGFGLGGNKLRKLEYHLAEERIRGVRTVITCGGAQSNHARVTAAAAASLGLRCVLVLSGENESSGRGNGLLHRLFGAEVRWVPSADERVPAMEEAEERERARGRRCVVIPLGASSPLGALGYLRCASELEAQLGLTAKPPGERTVIVVPTSSCGTLAGLLLGLSIYRWDSVTLLAVSADVTAEEIHRIGAETARGAAVLLGWRGGLATDAVTATDREVGGGYGIPTAASAEALRLFGRLEGEALDPVYTAKAAAAFLSEARRGNLGPNERLVFLHTGGHPALFL